MGTLMLDLEAVEATENLYPEGNIIRRDPKDQKNEKKDMLNSKKDRSLKKNISKKLEKKERDSFDTLVGSLVDIEI